MGGFTLTLTAPDFGAAARVLQGYKNRHAGRRCFVIGNGPSLRAADLDRLKENGEFSIASNRIYLIFSQTEWRPNVFTAMDDKGIQASRTEMSAVPAELKLVPVVPEAMMTPFDGALPLRCQPAPLGSVAAGTLPPFSPDITDRVHEGGTITYINLQIAAYLGFTEIVLLGMDHRYSKQQYVPAEYRNYDWARNPRGYDLARDVYAETRLAPEVRDHFCDGYMDGIVRDTGGGYFIEAATLAYQAAKRYAEAHGIRIVNATRGGRLNVFKRVGFDSLFKKA